MSFAAAKDGAVVIATDLGTAFAGPRVRSPRRRFAPHKLRGRGRRLCRVRPAKTIFEEYGASAERTTPRPRLDRSVLAGAARPVHRPIGGRTAGRARCPRSRADHRPGARRTPCRARRALIARVASRRTANAGDRARRDPLSSHESPFAAGSNDRDGPKADMAHRRIRASNSSQRGQ